MKLLEKDYKMMIEKLPNPVWVADREGFKAYFNEAWYKLSGGTYEENLGEGWTRCIHPEDLERVLAIYMESVGKRKEFITEFRIEKLDGEHKWVREHGVPILDEKGEYHGFLGTCTDLSDRHDMSRAAPLHDSDILTGLLSKDRFRSLLLQEIERTSRYESLLSIVYVDLDRFGEVNELYGFEKGNEVLRIIGDMVLYLSLIHI
mgnify:CR=1 FL=1